MQERFYFETFRVNKSKIQYKGGVDADEIFVMWYKQCPYFIYIHIYIFYIYFKCQQMYPDTYVSVRPVG